MKSLFEKDSFSGDAKELLELSIGLAILGKVLK